MSHGADVGAQEDAGSGIPACSRQLDCLSYGIEAGVRHRAPVSSRAAATTTRLGTPIGGSSDVCDSLCACGEHVHGVYCPRRSHGVSEQVKGPGPRSGASPWSRAKFRGQRAVTHERHGGGLLGAPIPVACEKPSVREVTRQDLPVIAPKAESRRRASPRRCRWQVMTGRLAATQGRSVAQRQPAAVFGPPR